MENITMCAPDEPLNISAPIAWQLAAKHCNRDANSGDSCAWNHGLWQFMRIMGLAGTAANRGEFYRRAIGAFAAANPAPRILISGTSDYAMLAQVIAAFGKADARPSVTVIDICETPLRLNAWYAERMSWQIVSTRSDMLRYEAAERFDLICTDSFLGRFPHAQWPQLAARWQSLLRPGGQLLTASRLHPVPPPPQVRFTDDQVLAFRNAVLHQAQQLRIEPAIDSTELARVAEQYGRRQSNYPLRSVEELQSLLQGAGFSIDELSILTRNPDNRHGIRAPSVPCGATFAGVVATRH